MSKKLDRRVIRTRNLIEKALVDLIREKRLKDITVNDITHHAGVNRTTFYLHFTDKFDLYGYHIERSFQEHLAEFVVDDMPLNKATFRALIYAVLVFILEARSSRWLSPAPSDLIMEARVQRVVFDRIMFWIEPNYLKGACDAGAEVAATATSWAIFGVATRLAEQNGSVPAEVVADELVRMLSGGLWNVLETYHAKVAQR